jgi:uncharacterized protein (DUF362 family)
VYHTLWNEGKTIKGDQMKKSIVSIVKRASTPNYDEIYKMLKESFDLLGGLEKYIPKGAYVVIKGNFFAPYPPPVIVDRRTVSSLVRQLYDAGAGRGAG